MRCAHADRPKGAHSAPYLTDKNKKTPAAPDPHPPTARPRLKSLRQFWLKLHLYIALGIGFMFVLLGLTGSFNVFQAELDEWLNPELVVKHPRGDYRPLDDVLRAVRNVYPLRGGAWMISLPRHTRGMLTATYVKPEEKPGALFAGLMVSVDPYTGEVITGRYFGETFVSWIFDLHWSLLMGETGHNIVGILGLILMLSVVTGICLWWPRGGKLGQALTIKRGASAARLNFDLHKTFGIYSAVVLLVLAFSGIYLVYPQYVQALVALLAPGTKQTFEPPEVKSTLSAGAKPISIAKAVMIADRVFPHAELKSVTTPDGPEGIYTVAERQPDEANRWYPSSIVWIDQYDGQVLAVRDPNQFTPAETLLNVQFPLHNGEALGLLGRILICATGVVPAVLYVTGIMHWLRKRRSSKHRATRLARRAPVEG